MDGSSPTRSHRSSSVTLAAAKAENAEITKAIVNGTEKGPKRQAVCMNAGAALYIAGKAESLEAGVKMAENLIDSGAAAAKLEEFIRLSNEI